MSVRDIADRPLEEGDVISLGKGHRVYAEIPKHFVYANHRGDFEMTHHEVNLSDDQFDYYRGDYVVVKAQYEGGGTGMGPHDIYPDGWHVFCVSVEKPERRVDFYQSGCFTCTIKDIRPIGRAELKWVFKDK